MREEIEKNSKILYDKFNLPIVFFDLETTDVDLNNAEIIEIFISKYDGSELTTYKSRFNTRLPSRPEAIEKHGILPEDVIECKFFHQCIDEIETFFLGEYILCGFNIPNFDIPIIVETLFKNDHIKLGQNIMNQYVFDCYREYIKQNPNTLEAIYARMFGTKLENAHAAEVDIFATLAISTKLIDDLEIDTSIKAIDTGGFFKKENNIIKFSKGKFKDQNIRDIDKSDLLSYLDWMINNKNMPKHTVEISKKLKKKIKELIN